MPGATPRLAIPYPLLAESANGPSNMQALATALDQAGIYGQGLLSARPTAASLQGRFYYATDTGILYLSNGTTWISVGPNVVGADSITAVHIAAGAVGQSELADDSVDTAAIQALAVTNAKIAAAAVDGAKIAASLKPSGGAGGATEALRALGTAAGQALSGTHPASTPPVAVYSAGPLYNGNTFTITAPVAGTYILEWGAGRFSSQQQGSYARITNSKTVGESEFSDVGSSGGPVAVPGVVCGAGEVIMFAMEITGASYLLHAWGKLTRTA